MRASRADRRLHGRRIHTTASFHKLTSYFNGEPVVLNHEPAAHSDGDSIVYFRHSEVISAGDLISTTSYPFIDRDKGGSIQGVINGLNHILDLAVAEYRSQGGTLDRSRSRTIV